MLCLQNSSGVFQFMLENFLEESLDTALTNVALFGKLVRTSAGVWELLMLFIIQYVLKQHSLVY